MANNKVFCILVSEMQHFIQIIICHISFSNIISNRIQSVCKHCGCPLKVHKNIQEVKKSLRVVNILDNKFVIYR